MLPFTVEQFFALFARYNVAIWPAQIFSYLLGTAAVFLLHARSAWSDRIIAAVLGAMWAWTGIGYHLVFFATINKAAYLFGVLFMIQAGALAYAGAFHHRIAFGARADAPGWLGAFFVLYAALLYPAIGVMTGHSPSELPMFGVTPCPVTIFTLGMLLLTRDAFPVPLLAIPVAWSLIGGCAAVLLQVPQDWLLLASGVIAAPLIVMNRRKRFPAQASDASTTCR
jgi:hypothetical protein